MTERNYEEEARSQGWVPENEWQGDPEKKPKAFLGAQEFVERGENFVGFQKGRADRLEAQVEQLTQSMGAFKEYHDQQIQKERDAAAQKIAELKAERAQAISEGDGQRFTKLDNQIDQLKSQQQAETPKVPESGLSQPAQQWLSQNSWYKKDPQKTAYADGVGTGLQQEGWDPNSPAYFNELNRRVEELFPSKTPSAGDVEGGTTPSSPAPGSPIEKTYDDLPADAKAACDRFVRDIPGMTKEQYVAEYDWSE